MVTDVSNKLHLQDEIVRTDLDLYVFSRGKLLPKSKFNLLFLILVYFFNCSSQYLNFSESVWYKINLYPKISNVNPAKWIMQLVKQPRRCLHMGESFVQSTTLDVSARFSSLVLKGQYVLIAIIKSQVLLQHRCSSNCAIKFRDVINLVSFHLAKISPYNAALN